MSQFHRVLITVFFTLLTASRAMYAQGIGFGGQVHLSSALSGQLQRAVDYKPAMGVGLHVDWLVGKHALRPRVDYVLFPSNSEPYSLASGEYAFTQKVSFLNCGLDYLYFVRGRADGWYLIGGLYFSQLRKEVRDSAAGYRDSIRSDKAGVDLGIGYQFTPAIGGEIRALNASSGGTARSAGIKSASLIEADVTFRF